MDREREREIERMKIEMEEKCSEDVVVQAAKRNRCSSNSSSSNKGIIVSMPNDVILNILSRLPPKTRVRFMYVCKILDTTISYDPLLQNSILQPFRKGSLDIILFKDNKFFYLHRHLIPPRRSKFLLSWKYLFTTPIDFLTRPNYETPPIMLRPVNGLVCLVDGYNIYVCNPITSEWISLPNCLQHLDLQIKRGMAFGYCHSPSSSSSRNLVYKLIQVSHSCLSYDPNNMDLNYPIKCIIHTVGSKLWRTIKSPKYPLRKDSVFIDGVIYWLVSTEVIGLVKIVSFHVGDEEFGEVLPPPQMDLDQKKPYLMELVELKGSLCLVDWIVDKYNYLTELHAWRMLTQQQQQQQQMDMTDDKSNRGGSSCCWVREYMIRLWKMARNYRQSNIGTSLNWELVQIKSGNIIFRPASSDLYCYNFKANRFKILFRNEQSAYYEHSIVSLGN